MTRYVCLYEFIQTYMYIYVKKDSPEKERIQSFHQFLRGHNSLVLKGHFFLFFLFLVAGSFCCTGVFSGCGEQGYSLVAVQLIVVVFLVPEHGL